MRISLEMRYNEKTHIQTHIQHTYNTHTRKHTNTHPHTYKTHIQHTNLHTGQYSYLHTSTGLKQSKRPTGEPTEQVYTTHTQTHGMHGGALHVLIVSKYFCTSKASAFFTSKQAAPRERFAY